MKKTDCTTADTEKRISWDVRCLPTLLSQINKLWAVTTDDSQIQLNLPNAEVIEYVQSHIMWDNLNSSTNNPYGVSFCTNTFVQNLGIYTFSQLNRCALSTALLKKILEGKYI